MEAGSFKTYLWGFGICLVLTLAAYFAASGHLFSKIGLDSTIGSLAAIQGCFFLFFYMELGRERSPYWNLIVFLFTVLVTVLLVVGSIWIMYHLNYNLMPHS